METPTAEESLLLRPPIRVPKCSPKILLVKAKTNRTLMSGRLKLFTKYTYNPIETNNIGANTLKC